MSIRLQQTTLIVFIVGVLVYLQVAGFGNTPLFGMLLALSGPALTGLLTTQATQNAIDKVNNTISMSNEGK